MQQNPIKYYFFQLPLEIKEKIFRMLNISSRYNASLVWKEMMEDRVDIRLFKSEQRKTKQLHYLEGSFLKNMAQTLSLFGEVNLSQSQSLSNLKNPWQLWAGYMEINFH